MVAELYNLLMAVSSFAFGLSEVSPADKGVAIDWLERGCVSCNKVRFAGSESSSGGEFVAGSESWC